MAVTAAATEGSGVAEVILANSFSISALLAVKAVVRSATAESRSADNF